MMGELKLPLHLSEALKHDNLTPEEFRAALLQLNYAMFRSMNRLSRALYDARHPAEEYQYGATIDPKGVVIQPQWEGKVRIETILASVPIGATAATLTLGNSIVIPLLQTPPASPTTSQTLVNIQNLGILLNRSDQRIFSVTGTTTSPFFVGLYGHAFEMFGDH